MPLEASEGRSNRGEVLLLSKQLKVDFGVLALVIILVVATVVNDISLGVNPIRFGNTGQFVLLLVMLTITIVLTIRERRRKTGKR